jgi:hypothetical protein
VSRGQNSAQQLGARLAGGPKSSTFTPSLVSMTGQKSWSVQIFGWFSEATGEVFRVLL